MTLLYLNKSSNVNITICITYIMNDILMILTSEIGIIVCMYMC